MNTTYCMMLGAVNSAVGWWAFSTEGGARGLMRGGAWRVPAAPHPHIRQAAAEGAGP